MNATQRESRRYPRFSVDVEARVRAPDGPLPARTRDVSRSGVCLVTSTRIDTGTDVELDLVLSFGGNAFSEPLSLRGRIVWCTPIAPSYQVGVMFDELTADQDTFLEMFLHFLDGTLAPKGAPAGAEADDDEEAPPSPDVKDDPFRA